MIKEPAESKNQEKLSHRLHGEKGNAMKITERAAREIAKRSKEITEGYTELIVSIYEDRMETRMVSKGWWIMREEWDKPKAEYRVSKAISIREAKSLPF